MRRALILMLALCLVLPVGAFCSGRMGFGADLASVQDVFLGQGSYQVALDVRTMVSEEFQIRIPMAVTFLKTSLMFEGGIVLVYYPWRTGPFMALSVFQMGFTSGCSNLENMVNLNEVQIGWTFEFGPGLFIEPSLAVRDPSGTFSDEYSRLKGTFPCYTTFRGKLAFGWWFWR